MSTDVAQAFLQQWEDETTHICKIPTYRLVDLSQEQVNQNLIQIRDYFHAKAQDFNGRLQSLKLQPFQWCKIGDRTTHNPTDAECLSSSYWVYGFRFGAENPERKLSLICHLDTVPANDDEWTPFDLKTVSYEYEGGTESPQDFLVGRGCIDDKGPAVSAFIVARALAKTFDGSQQMDSTQIEILFDTSEETDMSTPHYLEDKDTIIPDFGVVYDAQWCVRAEKGGERPEFTIASTPAPPGSLYISAMNTSPDNSTNTIPDWAAAEVTGDPELVEMFWATVGQEYESAQFDDPDYRKAKLKVERDESKSKVILTTNVMGAQHGSAPEENRLKGANPLVSLANFLAGLTDKETLAVNAASTTCEYIRWTWGTRVFGEDHESLYKSDEVFSPGDGTTAYNGTSYAVTKVTTDETGMVTLCIDIRYAIGHHKVGWDGVTEGLLEGDESEFDGIFAELTRKFNTEHPNMPNVSFTTSTLFAPDIRIPEANPDFNKAQEAYAEVMGMKPPLYAIGGGTDAKGHTFMLAVGPLMAKELGPPINYHGIGEGAPKADMCKSTEILFLLFKRQIEDETRRDSEKVKKAIERVKQMRKKGMNCCCNC